MVGDVMESMARVKKNSKKKGRSYYDFTLAFLIMFACAVGLIIIYSSSAYIAKSKNLESTYFLKRQLFSAVIGIGAMLIISRLNYKRLRSRFKFPVPGFLRSLIVNRSFTISIPWVLLVLMTALQAYTTYFAPENNGARRWITIKYIGSVQPSELAKVVVIVFGAYICYRKPRELNRITGFVKSMIYVAPLLYLI